MMTPMVMLAICRMHSLVCEFVCMSVFVGTLVASMRFGAQVLLL